MKLVSGGVQHETNTFARSKTSLADFIRDSNCGPDLAGGDIIRDRFLQTGTIHGGYLAGAAIEQIDLLPLLCARAQPSGVVEQSCFDELLQRFLDRLKSQLPVDGVLLDLHGAMVTDLHDDAEGVFIRSTRELVGDDIPIVVTLDFHANISPAMAEAADVIIGFDSYPHVDMQERGIEAVRLLANMVRGRIHPVQRFRQLPLLTLPPMQCTLREPMRSMMSRVHVIEQQPEILTATVAMGFPFADIPDCGVSVLVTADGNSDLAQQRVDQLAASLWELRDALQPQLTSTAEVIRNVREHAGQGPVILADGSDNPGGGAPCDGTIALTELVHADLDGVVVGVLYDPETAAQAHAAGVGNTIRVRLGGKSDAVHGPPLEMDAYVQALCDGRFVYRGPMMQGIEDQLGLTATLKIRGVEVVVSSIRRQCLDAEMLRVAGINPAARRLLVLKSAVHFRADFGPIAARMFDADTPGIHRPDFGCYEYRKRRRPVYPLDDVRDWRSP